MKLYLNKFTSSYEALFIHKSKKTHGFGRSENEAICNCIKNFIEALLEDEENFSINVSNLKETLKICIKYDFILFKNF